ncbi:phosphotransferase family protein [Rhodococcus sp. IEGM 1379]|uniref:phosphotransferase family protein n=1 Tax=Rhodococcus sp. IEGM 1379 TaxID=3047086 RepID=UPI0024B7430A|nr:phosphotransferase family protein [Rhodococcus sp. IEGM 1379]MDI9918812.1 phosphotransferase family protein [Rhodococcus sp. IEGM 1379]
MSSDVSSANDAEHHAQVARPSDSQRNTEDLRERLERWMAGKVPAGSVVTVADVTLPSANGMSSETILFDATWDGEHHPLVARVAPAQSTMPVFPTYDLESQFRTMAQVREHSDVPVPSVYWSESDSEALGAPFFVMERITGQVPPDVMPYNFGSWVSEATPAQRRTLQDKSVDLLAQLHGIEKPLQRFDFLQLPGSGPTAREAFSAHIADQRSFYEWTVADGVRSPLIERCLDWIEANNPADDSPAVLCWGDSRIGNVMYQDFEPVAVLDWEMATLGPREMDLAWMVFLHRFFEDIAGLANLPGLPDFLRIQDVATTYAELTGYTPADLKYYVTYAALRHATVMYRIQARAIAFGQAETPADPDDMIMHRASLTAMLDGTYWERLN